MTISRIQDDEKGVTAVFEMFPVLNPEKSKLSGRPVFDEIELCRVYLAANKQTVGAFPANSIWINKDMPTEWGTTEKTPITYAMRFNKQYLEFKAGGKQSFSGTLLSELPFLNQAKRLELKALNIHTAEALASLDGAALKMLGPGGRELKNQATAYIEKAREGVGANELADKLSQRDARIQELERRIESILPASVQAGETPVPAKEETINAFAQFDDESLGVWLKDAGVAVDGRWSRATMISKAEEVLAKSGKKQAA
jgi:hypothetical protein